jgi:hypothetical protein
LHTFQGDPSYPHSITIHGRTFSGDSLPQAVVLFANKKKNLLNPRNLRMKL